ncbi:MAG: GerMN domain-containing protein [Treponema sp.]|nr:GerMN domain-containing protein [Treponema sp.]
MKINTNSKTNKIAFGVIGAIVLAFLISLLVYAFSYKGNLRKFIFPSVDEGEYIVERRYLRKNPVDDPITVYVKELLLGSENERTKYLFAKKTRLISCFLADGVLYVNLSEDMLNLGDNVISFEESTKLLTKNIKQNFNGIKSVEIYVDGKSMYDSY